ncbi:MAG: AbrB/MazE/SpoVT family DNA-binding domain-containing protein [Halanaeroarchaeum sp.]
MTEDTRTVGEGGELIIPKELRQRYGIEAGDDVRFVGDEAEIRIKP